ncbi:MAG TPA: Mur ligase family protein, partial [Pyrinomonadaceae bacterium]
MQFDEAVNYLLSLGHETVAIKLGLANIEQLLVALGSPEHAYPAVQIAGTNGKGSTATMLESICRVCRVRAGLYTSPHLVSITERVRIAGHDIAREEFARLTAHVRAASLELQQATGALPTFFEQVTAIALVAFREANVSLAILETGLGGRLDATTAARAQTLAITPVALDHQEYLGHTLREIAAEKAAIIREGSTVVVASQPDEAREVILARCREQRVTPRFAARDVRVLGADEEGRLRVTFETDSDLYEEVHLSLRGRHQATNAAVALALAEVLRDKHNFPFTHDGIIEGLETATHAGRLELQAGDPPILFDGAHNPAGARALRQYLDEFVALPVTLVFGAMRDKALREIGAALFPAAERLVLTS